MAKPLEQLEAMRNVTDNWDGYGGAAPRPELIDAASSLTQHPIGDSTVSVEGLAVLPIRLVLRPATRC